MILSGIGEIAGKYWHEIPDHFPFAEPDVFAIMPNLVHGIIIINKTNFHRDANDRRDAINRVSTGWFRQQYSGKEQNANT